MNGLSAVPVMVGIGRSGPVLVMERRNLAGRENGVGSRLPYLIRNSRGD
jgi:hypothetical protein